MHAESEQKSERGTDRALLAFFFSQRARFLLPSRVTREACAHIQNAPATGRAHADLRRASSDAAANGGGQAGPRVPGRLRDPADPPQRMPPADWLHAVEVPGPAPRIRKVPIRRVRPARAGARARVRRRTPPANETLTTPSSSLCAHRAGVGCRHGPGTSCASSSSRPSARSERAVAGLLVSKWQTAQHSMHDAHCLPFFVRDRFPIDEKRHDAGFMRGALKRWNLVRPGSWCLSSYIEHGTIGVDAKHGCSNGDSRAK